MVSPLSLVIVNWNARTQLAACLRAAAPLGHPTIVVDNASGDGSVAMMTRDFPTVRLIASERNLGFAGGVNAGVAASSTPWVLLLNPDVTVTADAVELLLTGASASPDIGAAGGCLTDPGGRPQAGFAVRRLPTVATLIADLLFLDELWPGNPITTRYRARDLSLTLSQDVEQPAAACLLVRRAAFDAVRGFDARFHPAWFEDVDFCRRLHAAGWRIRYVAEARFVHEGGVAMRRLGPSGFAPMWYGNMTRYVDRHFRPASRVAYRVALLAGLSLRALLALLRGRVSAARAYVSAIPLAFRYP